MTREFLSRNTDIPIRQRRAGRRALSLLEVILAVAILGGCLAVTGELIRLGSRQAEEARLLMRAQLICESKLEEIAAGVLPAESVSSTAVETDLDWLYSVEVSPLEQEELLEVRVTVEQAESNRLVPLTFTLVRWIIDPSAIPTDVTGEVIGGAGV